MLLKRIIIAAGVVGVLWLGCLSDARAQPVAPAPGSGSPASVMPTEQTPSAAPTPAPAAAALSAPTAAPDLASPRATMTTFLLAMHDVAAGKPGGWERALACLNLAGAATQPGAEGESGQILAQQLYGVLNRIETIDVEGLPDATQVRATGADHYLFFPRLDRHEHQAVLAKLNGKSPGQIILRRQADGRWLFSAVTVADIPALYNAMAALPEVYDARGNRFLSMLGPTFARTRWWDWGMVLLTIFVGVVLGKIMQSGLRGGGDRLHRRQRHYRATVLHNLASPSSLLLVAGGLQIGLGLVYMESDLRDLTDRAVKFLYLLSVGWFLYNAIEVLDLWLRELTAKTQTKLDDMVVPLIRKTLRIFLVMVFALTVAQTVFGMDITSWLAGLGIAGLAVSLAAQDSVKNLFGSITVFFDRPFMIGDFISFDGQDGVVEEIGFRSTKMRTLDGHLVTVPNMKFIDNSVRNISARPAIKRVLDVTITYDTPAEKIEEGVRIIKDILAEAQFTQCFDMANLPPRVVFNDYNAASLNIRVFYWYMLTDGRDYWTSMDFAQAFNLRLFRAYADAGIEFAFPTQTLYLAGDPKRPLSIGTNPS